MVRQVEDAFGPVSLLVNNAGVAGQALFQDITDELWHRYFSVNVDGAVPRHPGGAARTCCTSTRAASSTSPPSGDCGAPAAR